MLRRFAPFMVLALIVLASVGVFVIRAITADRGRCAELYGMLIHPEYPAKNRYDFYVRLADSQQAYSRRIEDASNRCGLPTSPDYPDWLKASYVEAVQTRIEACDPVTVGRHREVPAGRSLYLPRTVRIAALAVSCCRPPSTMYRQTEHGTLSKHITQKRTTAISWLNFSIPSKRSLTASKVRRRSAV